MLLQNASLFSANRKIFFEKFCVLPNFRFLLCHSAVFYRYHLLPLCIIHVPAQKSRVYFNFFRFIQHFFYQAVLFLCRFVSGLRLMLFSLLMLFAYLFIYNVYSSPCFFPEVLSLPCRLTVSSRSGIYTAILYSGAAGTKKQDNALCIVLLICFSIFLLFSFTSVQSARLFFH